MKVRLAILLLTYGIACAKFSSHAKLSPEDSLKKRVMGYISHYRIKGEFQKATAMKLCLLKKVSKENSDAVHKHQGYFNGQVTITKK